MKWRSPLTAAAYLIVGWTAAKIVTLSSAGREAQTTHVGLRIEQVQALECLVTNRVEIADVVETQLQGRTGGIKAVILMKGDLLLGVDLSQASFEQVDAKGHTAVLVLPQPRATGPRVDHERTKIYAVSQSGLWAYVPGGDASEAQLIECGFRDAQRFLAEAGGQGDLIALARKRAESVISAYFTLIDWSVTVRWRQ